MSVNITKHGNNLNCLKDPVQIKQELFKQKRKQRLAQVRIKSKELAAKVRNSVKEENLKTLKSLDTKKTTELKIWRQKAIAGLQNAHQNSVMNFGEAHCAAIIENELYFPKRTSHTVDNKKYNKMKFSIINDFVQEPDRIRGGGSGSGNPRLSGRSNYTDADYSSIPNTQRNNQTESRNSASINTNSNFNKCQKSSNNSFRNLSKSFMTKCQLPPPSKTQPTPPAPLKTFIQNRNDYLLTEDEDTEDDKDKDEDGKSSNEETSEVDSVTPSKESLSKFQKNSINKTNSTTKILKKINLKDTSASARQARNSTTVNKVKFALKNNSSRKTNHNTLKTPSTYDLRNYQMIKKKQQNEYSQSMNYEEEEDSDSENVFTPRKRAGSTPEYKKSKKSISPSENSAFKPQRIVLECHMQKDNTLSCKTIPKKELKQSESSILSISMSETDNSSCSSSSSSTSPCHYEILPPYCGLRKSIPNKRLSVVPSVVLEVGSDDSCKSDAFSGNIEDEYCNLNRHFSRVQSNVSLRSITSNSDEAVAEINSSNSDEAVAKAHTSNSDEAVAKAKSEVREETIDRRGRFTQISDLLNKIKRTFIPKCTEHILCDCAKTSLINDNISKSVCSRGVGTDLIANNMTGNNIANENDVKNRNRERSKTLKSNDLIFEDKDKQNTSLIDNKSTRKLDTEINDNKHEKSVSNQSVINTIGSKEVKNTKKNEYIPRNNAKKNSLINYPTRTLKKKIPITSQKTGKSNSGSLSLQKPMNAKLQPENSGISISSKKPTSSTISKGLLQKISKESNDIKHSLGPGQSQVDFYDYNNKYEMQYNSTKSGTVIQKSAGSEESTAQNNANIERQIEKSRETELELLRDRAEKRGKDAIEREQVRREYEVLQNKLDALTKDKLLNRAVLQPQDQNIYSELRLKQISDSRKSRINSAIEDILQRPCVITCPEIKCCTPLVTENIPNSIQQNKSSSINLANYEDLCLDQSDSCCSILLNYVNQQESKISDDIENCESIEKIDQLKLLLNRLASLKNELIKEIKRTESNCNNDSVQFVTSAVEELQKERDHIIHNEPAKTTEKDLDKREKRIEKKQAILERKLREFYELRQFETLEPPSNGGGNYQKSNQIYSANSVHSIKPADDCDPIEIIIKLKGNTNENPSIAKLKSKEKIDIQEVMSKSSGSLSEKIKNDNKSDRSGSTIYKSPPPIMSNAISKLIKQQEKLNTSISPEEFNEKMKNKTRNKNLSTNKNTKTSIAQDLTRKPVDNQSNIRKSAPTGSNAKNPIGRSSNISNLSMKTLRARSGSKLANTKLHSSKDPNQTEANYNRDPSPKLKSKNITSKGGSTSKDLNIKNTLAGNNNNDIQTTDAIKKSVKNNATVTKKSQIDVNNSTKDLKAVPIKSTGSIKNPELNTYIQRLLGMSRNSINMLGASSSCSIDTPNSSICQIDDNMTEQDCQAQRINQLQQFIEENYSLLSEIEESLKLDDNNSSALSDTNQKMISEIWRKVFEEKQLEKQKQTAACKNAKNDNTKSIKPILRKDKQKCIGNKKLQCPQSDSFHEKSDQAKLEYLECFTEASDIVNQRIFELTKMINRVRREKQKIYENTISSNETKSDTCKNSTEYLDFATNNKSIQYKPTSTVPEPSITTPSSSYRTSKNVDRPSSPTVSNNSQRLCVPELNLYENIQLEKNKLTGASRDSGISLSRPLTAMEPCDSPDINTDCKAAVPNFEPLLKDIPKPNNDMNSIPVPATVIEKNKRIHKPPPTLTRFSPQIVEDIPHELSTIFETDTPGTSRIIVSSRQLFSNNQLDDPKVFEAQQSNEFLFTKFPSFEEFARMNNLDIANFDAETNAELQLEFQELLELTQSLKDVSYKKFPPMNCNDTTNSTNKQDSINSSSYSSDNKKNGKNSFDSAIRSLKNMTAPFNKFPSSSEYFKSVGARDLLSQNTFENTTLNSSKCNKIDNCEELSCDSLPDINQELKRRNIIKKSFSLPKKNSSEGDDDTYDDVCSTSMLSSTKISPRMTETNSLLEKIEKSLSSKSKPTESDEECTNLSWAAAMLKKTKLQNAQSSSTTSSSPYSKPSNEPFKLNKQMINISNTVSPNSKPCEIIIQSTNCSTDSSIPGNPINLRAFLAQELQKRTQNSGSSSDDSSLGSLFLRSIIGTLTPTSENLSNNGGQSTDRQQKTSTPVHVKSPDLTANNNNNDPNSTLSSSHLFSGESRLSSVRCNKSNNSDRYNTSKQYSNTKK